MSHACDICNRIFNYPSILKMHYRSHTGEKPFQCEFCKKLFPHEAHLIVHNQIHIQKEQYVCELCNNTFLQKSSLEEHTELHKDERKDEACVIEGFPSENGLDRRNVTLKRDKLHSCVICSEVFSKECDLNRHFLAHEDGKPLSSDKKCDETLSKKSELSVPDRIRRKQRIFICDTCGEAFSKEENFKTHKRDHTKEKPFEFDKLFSRKDKFNLHHRVHKNEKPFECDVCDKSFSRKDKLNRHRRVHTNEKPFECDVCDKSFSRKDSLNLHRRVHTNERPFMCNTCGKLFSRKDKLKLHHRVHTKIEPLSVMNAVKHLRGPLT